MIKDYMIIIQARLNSSRLPRKILLQTSCYQNLTLIEYMYKRIIENCKFSTVYAIPDNAYDDELANFLTLKNIKFYRGSENDLISRYIIGAEMFSAENIIRLTSDCPLVDPYLVTSMVEHFEKNQLDYLGNTTPPHNSTFPDGADIEIFTRKALRKANYEIYNKKYREHVTFQFWKDKHGYASETFSQLKSFSHLRYTIDNPEDFKVFNAINEQLILKSNKFCGYKEIQAFLDKNLNIRKLNMQYKPGDNW